MIDIQVSGAATSQYLRRLNTQLPFAVASAVNKVAIDAQTAVRQGIHSRFIVRRSVFIDRSVKISPFADKRTLTALLKTEAPGGARDVLAKFESGGPKSSLSGGRIAIPTTTVRPNITSVVPSGKRPRALANTFVMKTKSGKTFIVVPNPRKGGHAKKGQGTKGNRLQFAYQLKPSVPLPANLEFVQTVRSTVTNMWERRMLEAWNHALATAH